ncbi:MULTISPECIES: TetR/AcrR family transcriptional regulator [unclassified Thalassospira]|uniref:TetR/AcrR family transcriptional regulator n=1 Tax=unclassified Thalassospira TaxID=2648997 RepID=UPI000EEB6F94|nr:MULTISPECIES: TetR/AcrR family transcriptional regulator [unclassified Thalassospira]HAI29771.1 TetR/AcrR family transcriptional regulator [Thalassospira sp.]
MSQLAGKTPKRQRGRPKDEAKAIALLDAARHLLLTKGLDVTLEEISICANVSRATIYSRFESKEDLIEAVIRRESDLTITDEEFQLSENLPVKEALIAFGTRYLNFINGRELHGWDRLISSASAAHPELPRKFFDAGPGRGQQMLVDIISKAASRNELCSLDAVTAADELTGLWMGLSNLEIKLGAREPFTQVEIEQKVARGVTLFLKIYGPDCIAM